MTEANKVIVKEWKVTALTDIWTGTVYKDSNDGKKPAADGSKSVNTGLLGSIRWWFEVLVRGLGGYACDPSGSAGEKHRCPDHNVKNATDDKHHCVVCELFGCTNWARKFRFEVRKYDEKWKMVGIQDAKIERNDKFGLRFTELRPIKDEEWALLELTMRLISRYGAIGGKTVLTRSDYGLVKLIGKEFSGKKDQIVKYCNNPGSKEWRIALVTKDLFAWASLRNFWLLPEVYFDKSQFKLLKQGNAWLAGEMGKSKKIFSFKKPARTFGFVQNPDNGFIDNEVCSTNGWKMIKGIEVIDALFIKEGNS